MISSAWNNRSPWYAPKGALVNNRLDSFKELLSDAETATGLRERIVAVLGKAAQLAGLRFR